ncbi:hypothetical protein [Enterobacter sp. PTB]|uniref:hypothetical protein n=1 Tax=Enterobacter sp. PTB TaxID=3143437 RepID=UPI003DA8CD20
MIKTNNRTIKRFNVVFRAVNRRGYTRGITLTVDATNTGQATQLASKQMMNDGYQELRIVRVIGAG